MRANFVLALIGMLCIAACGGGSSSLSGSGGGSGSTVNVQSVTVDSGPTLIANSTTPAVNTLYTTVTICAPGSTSNCQTIDHIQVDTGSSGLRILANNTGFSLSLPAATDAAGNALAECVQFVDGSSWGSVRNADIKIAGESAAGMEIQVIGDGAFPTAPGTCPAPIENTVQQFGANGILGVGAFISDCGPACTVANSTYYSCPTPASCAETTVAETLQVSNPVASFATDNNGVIIQLPSVAASGAASVTGSLIFGIGTQSNNALGSARILTVDATNGRLTTLYKGASLTASFIDSGSNGYFFPDTTIMQCTDGTTFYCPTSPLSESGTIQGVNGTSVLVDFTVTSESALFSGSTVIAAAPGLAGSNATSGSGSNGASSFEFDWGLPFYYGRNVYTAIDTKNAGGTTGPYFAF